MKGNTRFWFVPVAYGLLILISACSSGSNGSNSATPETDFSGGIVNGYHLVSSIRYDEFDQVIQTSELIYDLEFNQIDTTTTNIGFNEESVSSHRIYYDQHGRLERRETPDDGQLRESIYAFDSEGRILTYFTGGSLNLRSEFEYDASGRLSRVVENALDAQNEPGYMPLTRTYTYNANGFLAASQLNQSYFDVASSQTINSTRNTSYFTNEFGQIIRAETTETDVDTLFTRSYAYDNNGNMVERTSSDGVYFDRTVYEYARNQEPIYNHWARQFRFFP